ncbi:hypothetical protein GCM10011519_16330 [Marmoricola endophyticus]|uniref:Uncharacterized protein n=1 Tax=Marmoricola endophyticus TaxID=2040280 RepID=A0A917BHQ1_9ACTN|nr:hypothetical protein [Marmoricola endophyticus]GGF43184.1 hypothetical protein GCM10011519_16330 [Marmoricola endophyticus]
MSGAVEEEQQSAAVGDRRRLRAPLVLAIGLCLVTAVLGGLLLASVVTIADRVLTGSFTMLPDSGMPARSRQPVPLAPLWLRISGVILAVDVVASLVPLFLLRLDRRFAALSGLTQGLAAWLIGSALGVLLLIVVGLLS